MQLRFDSKLTLEQYLRQRGWELATLASCPLHPAGGCGYARLGVYVRKVPESTPVARWYCRKGRTTFSLLPDFFASRLPGLLDDVERAAAAAESARSVAAAAEQLRPGDMDGAVTTTSAERWLRRRVTLVATVLVAVVGILPGRLAGVSTVAGLRERLDTVHALVALREIAAKHITALPRPLGFGPQRGRGSRRGGGFQHDLGPDPPEEAG